MSERATLIRGGVIVTMDPVRRVLEGDVLVVGDRIAAVGKVRAAAIPAGARLIEAAGHAVIPGLVQAHVHLCQALFRGMADDLPLLEWLRMRIWPLEAAHDERSLGASARLGLAEMLCAGTTTILDMGTVHAHDAVMEAIADSGMRALSGKAMMDAGDGVPKRLRESTRASIRESERLATRWHGAADGRIGYAWAPRFILSCSAKLLREAAERASARGQIVHTHAAEHAAEREAVRKVLGKQDVAALAELGVTGPRAVIAHGVQLEREEMRELGRAGTRVVHCPSANLKLASGIADVVAMRAAGIVVGLGSDGAPCNNRMDPWTELRQAALLAKVRRDDAAAMPAMEALALATIDGARALGLDAEIGSIEPGKKADLAVVDLDGLHALPGGRPETRLVYSCTPADVRHVLVDGALIVRDRELTTLDTREVRADALRQARRLVVRARI